MELRAVLLHLEVRAVIRNSIDNSNTENKCNEWEWVRNSELVQNLDLSRAFPLEKAMGPHSSTLAWKIPWTEEPGRLQSMGSLRVGHDWVTSLSLFTFMHWRRQWQPTPVFLPGESQGWRSLVGCCLWGRTESDTTEATKKQQLELDMEQQTGSKSGQEYVKAVYCRAAYLTYMQNAVAAAKSLQSCLTLCKPIDGNPPGSVIPGILQARTLEWVAISFSNAGKWKVKEKSLSRVWLFTTLWTTAYQAPPSMGFPRQEYWNGLPFPSPGNLPDPRTEPRSLTL